MTLPEATRLANARATLTSATVHARVPSGAGPLVLTGQVDFVQQTGRCVLDGRALQWDPTQLIYDGRSRALRHDGSELDTTLLLLVSLHTSVPGDPEEIRRTVRWVRSEELDGVQVDVFEGDRLTYWLDDRLRRVQARLGHNPDPATIDFT
jgi:hypothetical protein